MRDYHHYGPNGEYRGSTSRYSPDELRQHGYVAVILLLCGLGWAIWYFGAGPVTELLSDLRRWPELKWPEKAIAAYYYYLVVVPGDALVSFGTFLWHNSFTKYPNLNKILGVAIIVVAGLMAIFMAAVVKALATLCRVRSPFLYVFGAPVALLLVWFAASWLIGVASDSFEWLFASG